MTTLLSGISETLSLIGPAYVEGSSVQRPSLLADEPVVGDAVPHVEAICQIVELILDKKALCQNDPDEEPAGADEDDEMAELDSVLIQCAGDVVSALASSLGQAFQPLFQRFYSRIVRYYVRRRALLTFEKKY